MDEFDILIDVLKREDFKKLLVNRINENVNIPIVNESAEGVIFTSLYDIIIETVANLK